jgi:hypothetical protein
VIEESERRIELWIPAWAEIKRRQNERFAALAARRLAVAVAFDGHSLVFGHRFSLP